MSEEDPNETKFKLYQDVYVIEYGIPVKKRVSGLTLNFAEETTYEVMDKLIILGRSDKYPESRLFGCRESLIKHITDCCNELTD